MFPDYQCFLSYFVQNRAQVLFKTRILKLLRVQVTAHLRRGIEMFGFQKTGIKGGQQTQRNEPLNTKLTDWGYLQHIK